MSGTSPDTLSAKPPDIPYGLLGPYPWQTVNVQDFGAVGDGVTDDGQAFQDALDAIAPTGGTFIIPPAPSGVYLIGQCLRHPSNVVIRGGGASATLQASSTMRPSPDYGGTSMWLNVNAESDETEFTGYRDFNITFENVFINMTGAPSYGAAHGIMHRAVQRVRNINCSVIGGASAFVSVTCDDYLVFGCRATDQVNCCYDHWGGSTNVRVIGCYGKIAETSGNQVVNFNAVRTGGTPSGPTETWVSDGFVLADCDLYGPTTAQRSINLEPLGINCTAKNVRMIGNRCFNVRVVWSGNSKGYVISNNIFTNSTGGNNTLWGRNSYTSLIGDDITISFNKFVDCNAPSSQGIIDTTSTNTRIYGNTAIGGTYDYGFVFRNTTGYGAFNSFPDAAIATSSGNYDVSGSLRMGGEKLEFLTSTNDHRPYFQTSGGSLFLVSTNAANGPRSIWSIATGSDAAAFSMFTDVNMGGLVRNGYAGALVATGSGAGGALVLTKQNNVVATTASGTGVRLPVVNGGAGARITVYNDGANTLTVYPPATGTLNGGASDTIASGASKAYLTTSNINYRTAA